MDSFVPSVVSSCSWHHYPKCFRPTTTSSLISTSSSSSWHPLLSTFFPSRSTLRGRLNSLCSHNKIPRAIKGEQQQQKYVYPDPIPEFAEAETHKFQEELRKRLSKDKETFGDDIDMVVMVCAEMFSNFLHKEYGGPGTLLVEPFTDMLLALKEKKLPGAPIAAREALLWAQNHVDRDWEIWTFQGLG